MGCHCHEICTLLNPSFVLTHQSRLGHATFFLVLAPLGIPTRRPLRRTIIARFHHRRGRPIRNRVRRARSRIIRSSRTDNLKLHGGIALPERARSSADSGVVAADGAGTRRYIFSGNDTLKHF